MHHKRDTSFNFVMKNGDMTTYPCIDIKLEKTLIPADSVVRKIKLREYSEIDEKYSQNNRNLSPRIALAAQKI